MNLTPKQIQALRVAVAEAAGYKITFTDLSVIVVAPAGALIHHSLPGSMARFTHPEEVFRAMCEVPHLKPEFAARERTQALLERCTCPFPNYPESLDAVHEMEQALTDEQWDAHWKNLNQVVEAVKVNETYACWQSYKRIYGATAMQRCIALLMTINPEKWLEIQNLKD